jgi:hypothetical protein
MKAKSRKPAKEFHMHDLHQATLRVSQSLIALALGIALPVAAGTATVVSSEGQPMVFEYSGEEFLRMNSSEESYMLVRDNTLYIVGYQEGEPMVFDASSMMRGFSGMLAQAAPSATTNEFVSLEKTGRSETVAGIKGDVYLLTVREDGKERTDEVVMSDDERAIEMLDALFSMSRAALAALDDPKAAKNSRELRARLDETGLGILRVGEELKVTEISGDKVAAARFELPAEPMDMQGLGAMMGSMGASGADSGEEKSAGGFFSGMMESLNSKVDRQSDRASDKVEDEVDEETDDAVDNVLNKAFGKLFGRDG